MSPHPPRSARPHLAARLEDWITAVERRLVLRRGWRPMVLAYTGYGSPDWIRVFGRVLLSPEPAPGPAVEARPGEHPARGWRRFLTVPVDGQEVVVEAGDRSHRIRTRRGGFLDEVLPVRLNPGWHEIRLRLGEQSAVARVRVVGPHPALGLVSDIDDTVLITHLPRPLVAAWNTFVVREHARVPVPGMAGFYDRLLDRAPDAPVVYLSTGAWNTAPTLTRFLARHRFPEGPLLLTDWGPTNTGWFRSGQEHKQAALRRLAADLPWIRWVLVGDDGQHDPRIYADFARERPDVVAGIAIRRLTATQQVLTANAQRSDKQVRPSSVPTVTAPDGDGLAVHLDVLTGSQGADPTAAGGPR
jgi:phosphatidate phosphatase APP1